MSKLQFKLGFGKSFVRVEIDESNLLDVLKPNQINYDLTGKEEVRRALSNPIGTKRLKDMVRPGERIAIITSDITRPMPSKQVLPEIINELIEGGIDSDSIKIVFGLGSHRKHTEEEKKHLVGDAIYSKIECIDSDSSNCINIGTTSRGTPVDIFKVVAEADRRICLGNIEYHYFAGYSGGAKAIMPGVSTRDAIQANHRWMVEDYSRAGQLDNNPVREDIDEVAKFLSIDFILNVVLDENKKIIKAVAGHYIEAHREGCRFLDSIYKVRIPTKADIVIVSPGGYPKDINLYQAQKALNNASHAVKPGGILILVASCKEGLGEQIFERWLTNASSPESMINKIRSNFELGGHKAAAIAMVLSNASIFLVSEMDSSFVKKLFLEPYYDVKHAVKEAFNRLGLESEVLIMPYGGSTLPVLT